MREAQRKSRESFIFFKLERYLYIGVDLRNQLNILLPCIRLPLVRVLAMNLHNRIHDGQETWRQKTKHEPTGH